MPALNPALVALVLDHGRATSTGPERGGKIPIPCPSCKPKRDGTHRCDLTIDVEGNGPAWHCFRCNSGGGCLAYCEAFGLDLPPLDTVADTYPRSIASGKGRSSQRPSKPRSRPSGPNHSRESESVSPAKGDAASPVDLATLEPSKEPPKALHHPEYGKPSSTWRLCREDGALMATHARFDDTAGKKEAVRWWRSGKWSLKADGISSKDFIYGAELLPTYDAAAPVYLAEGEKCADLLRSIGLQSAATVCGASSTPTAAALAPLSRFEVVTWPDADESGRKHMTAIAAVLRQLAPAESEGDLVVALDPVALGLDAGGADVEQWLEQHDGAELDALRERLAALVETHRPDPILGPWSTAYEWSEDVAVDVDAAVTPIARFLAFPGAVTLFAAREKSGKTTVASQAAAAVAMGARFGGLPTVEGRVLIVTEEAPETVVRRLALQGARDVRRRIAITSPRALALAADRAKLPNRVEALAASVEHVRPVLVLIDTLDSLRAGVVGEASRSDDWPKVFEPLQHAARSTGCGVVILHHAAKHGGGSRDSTAIAASVDLLIEPGNTDAGGRVEYISKGRVLDTGDFAVHGYRRETETVIVEGLDGTADTRQREAQREAWLSIESAILDHVEAHPGATAAALRTALREKPAMVDAGIGRLLRKGLIEVQPNGSGLQVREEPS